jgi:hypothetical protein
MGGYQNREPDVMLALGHLNHPQATMRELAAGALGFAPRQEDVHRALQALQESDSDAGVRDAAKRSLAKYR